MTLPRLQSLLIDVLRIHVMRLGILLTGLMLLISVASAHRGHGVWTDIVWSGNHFEITHRFHAADGLAANRFVGGSGALTNAEDLARLALYVEQRFAIVDTISNDSDTNQVAELKTLGAEVDDDFVYVYQEWWPLSLPDAALQLKHSVLLDVEPSTQIFVRIDTPKGIEERRL